MATPCPKEASLDDERAEDPVVAKHVQPASLPSAKEDIDIQSFDKVSGAEDYSQREQDIKLRRYVEQQRRKRAYLRTKATSDALMKRRLQRTEPYKAAENVVAPGKEEATVKNVLGPVLIIGAAVGMAAYVMINK